MNSRTTHFGIISLYRSMGYLFPCISDEEFGVNLIRSGAWTQNKRRRKMRHLNNH